MAATSSLRCIFPRSSSASILAIWALDAFIVTSAVRRAFSSRFSSSSASFLDLNATYRWTESHRRKRPSFFSSWPSSTSCRTLRPVMPKTQVSSDELTSVSDVIFAFAMAAHSFPRGTTKSGTEMPGKFFY